jgi:DNA-binding PadR family transcriptional regulator
VSDGDLPELALAEWLVLALLAEGATHGWPIVRELSRQGPIGTIWTVPRAKVYRAIERLEELALVLPGDPVEGDGPARTLLHLAPGAARTVTRWLGRPVGHLRDMRSELLVKLVLRERRGLDLGPLIRRQRAALLDQVEALSNQAGDSIVALWRSESARSAQRFLDQLEARRP